MLFSEPKIPQCNSVFPADVRKELTVSVLFSEPKIPQCHIDDGEELTGERFSALQRAENSSMLVCGSPTRSLICFSALQRAENSSISPMCSASLPKSNQVSVLFSEPKIPQSARRVRETYLWCRFQCSSASRKFLNTMSAARCAGRCPVSVLFSEPKIPQYSHRSGREL